MLVLQELELSKILAEAELQILATPPSSPLNLSAPILESLQPSSGPADIPTRVKLQGKALQHSVLHFDGQPLSEDVLISDTAIYVSVTTFVNR